MDNLTKTLLVSALVLLSATLLIYGSGVLVPLALGLLIWFLINAIAGGLQWLSVAGLTMPRALAFMLSMASIVVAGFMVVDFVISNLSAMSVCTLDFDDGHVW